MHKLPIVIKAIGSERTVNELIPWLEESICIETPKFEDELLLALAEEIEKGWKKFGLRDERTAFFKIL
jgi:serine/threonine-protein phosphatase 2A regulatory subunit A